MEQMYGGYTKKQGQLRTFWMMWKNINITHNVIAYNNVMCNQRQARRSNIKVNKNTKDGLVRICSNNSNLYIYPNIDYRISTADINWKKKQNKKENKNIGENKKMYMIIYDNDRLSWN